jgi:hypothetical protein
VTDPETPQAAIAYLAFVVEETALAVLYRNADVSKLELSSIVDTFFPWVLTDGSGDVPPGTDYLPYILYDSPEFD